MKKNKLLYLFIIFLSFFFVNNVNAEIIYGKDTSNYKKTSSVNPVSYNNMFNNFSDEALSVINDYFNENYGSLNDGYKYVLVVDFGGNYNITFNENTRFSLFRSKVLNFDFDYQNGFPVQSSTYKCFTFDLTSLSFSDSFCSSSYYNTFSTLGYRGFIMWSDKDYLWKDLISKDYESFAYFSSPLNERYTKFIDFNIVFEYNEPVYTLMDLVGLNTSKIPANQTNYTINYYFDNVLDNSKTETHDGVVGSTITEFTDYSDDNYYLVNNDYKLVLSSNEEENVLNIYYKSYVWTNYTIEYYFDDIKKEHLTETYRVYVDTLVNEFTDYSDDYWSLVENDYSLTTQEDSSLNVLRVYFRSKNYGTEYQTIDTSKSKIPFFFQFTDIKEMFTGINFDIFTQFEQFLITIFINIFFLAFIFFIVYFVLKLVYKVLQFF